MKNEKELEQSSTVANNMMNRERGFVGSNSYESDLKFGISDFLESIGSSPSWLDVACGTGRALIEAKTKFPHLNITAIDLVDFRLPEMSKTDIRFLETSVSDYDSYNRYDLITCVHGFHYFGDKLGNLIKLTSMLKTKGMLIANFDHTSIRDLENRSMGDQIVEKLLLAGFEFDAEKRILRCNGAQDLDFGLLYVGSDDNAGPNYTGQNAVSSFYEEV